MDTSHTQKNSYLIMFSFSVMPGFQRSKCQHCNHLYDLNRHLPLKEIQDNWRKSLITCLHQEQQTNTGIYCWSPFFSAFMWILQSSHINGMACYIYTKVILVTNKLLIVIKKMKYYKVSENLNIKKLASTNFQRSRGWQETILSIVWQIKV